MPVVTISIGRQRHGTKKSESLQDFPTVSLLSENLIADTGATTKSPEPSFKPVAKGKPIAATYAAVAKTTSATD